MLTVLPKAPSSGYSFGDYCVTNGHTMHILDPGELGQQALHSPSVWPSRGHMAPGALPAS